MEEKLIGKKKISAEEVEVIEELKKDYYKAMEENNEGYALLVKRLLGNYGIRVEDEIRE